LAALAISTVLYIATAIAAVSAIGAEALSASERPLADVVATVAGSASGDLIAVAALISTTNTTLLAMTAASRMTYGMANLEAMPRWLGGVTRRTRVPLRSITAIAIVAALFAVAADLKLLAQVTDLSIYFVFVSVNGALIVLRYRDPDRERPFRSPLRVGRLPLLPIAGILSVGVLVTGLELSAMGAGAAVCAAGLVLGLALDARSPLRKRFGRGAGGAAS
jgi:APA family basic amino acid/polyamine antiporter